MCKRDTPQLFYNVKPPSIRLNSGRECPALIIVYNRSVRYVIYGLNINYERRVQD